MCAIIRAGELDKNAALVSNLCANTSDSHGPSIGRSIVQFGAKMTLNEYPTVAHDDLVASLIQTMHQMILKHPLYGSSKRISTLLLAASQQGKLI